MSLATGAGKSSVLEIVEAGFVGDDDGLCLKFDGWRFQGFEDAKIALIEGIVTGLVEKRPAMTKAAGGGIYRLQAEVFAGRSGGKFAAPRVEV